MSKQPATLYRYRTFSTETLDALCNDSLYFAHPGTFNDPLDCRPTLNCDSDLESLRELLEQFVFRRVYTETLDSFQKIRIAGDKATAFAENRGNKEASRELLDFAYYATNPEYSEGPLKAEEWLLVQAIEQQLLLKYDNGVCCFAEEYNNPLLWSHYGDQHQGLCVGYGLDRIPKPVVRKVNYDGNRKIKTSTLVDAFIHNNPNALDALDRDIFLRKAKDWKYEKEWRLIGPHGLQESPLLLKEITFGLRCPRSVKHTIVQALSGRDRSVEYYEMSEERGSYCLDRNELNLDDLNAHYPRTAFSASEAFGD